MCLRQQRRVERSCCFNVLTGQVAEQLGFVCSEHVKLDPDYSSST